MGRAATFWSLEANEPWKILFFSMVPNLTNHISHEPKVWVLIFYLLFKIIEITKIWEEAKEEAKRAAFADAS